jgi:hypothetical protein
MKQHALNNISSKFLKDIIQPFISIVLCCFSVGFVLGCPAKTPLIEEDNYFLRFIVPNETDDQCDGPCEPRQISMCNVLNNAESVVIVRVSTVDSEFVACEERPYRRSPVYFNVEFLRHVVGVDPGVLRDVLSFSSHGLEEDDVVIMGLYQLDGKWISQSILPVELVSDQLEADEARINAEHGLIVDLPTDYNRFRSEAQSYWANYDDFCGESRLRFTVMEARDHYYGDCGGVAERPYDETTIGDETD